MVLMSLTAYVLGPGRQAGLELRTELRVRVPTPGSIKMNYKTPTAWKRQNTTKFSLLLPSMLRAQTFLGTGGQRQQPSEQLSGPLIMSKRRNKVFAKFDDS